MKLAIPPGVRTTLRLDGSPGDGGTWRFAVRHENKSATDDVHALFDQLAPSDRDILIEEMQKKLDLGASGRLQYGETLEDGQVCQMHCVSNVLELRFDDQNCFNAELDDYESRKIRIYYCEPDRHLGSLIILSMKHKAPGPLGLEEQDAHAREASKLATEHGLIERV